MKAMIFAAGLGTRLKPLTDEMPKALVPVCGQPLLYHVLEKLKAAGVDETIVNVHHFPDMIRQWIEHHDTGIKVSISDERDFLRETGGGIKYAEPLLKGSGGFLVHNVDILSNLDIAWLMSQVHGTSLSTLVVSERKTSRYLLFNDEMRMVGWTNVTTGEVRTPFKDLDVSKCRKLAFSGIHYISDGIFDLFRKKEVSDRFSITDFYIDVCADYPIMGVVPEDFRMIDVGKLDTLAKAEEFLA
ncbi:MAG: NTP transferase domain-containing protein [Bacteroidales bacterium]|nr:NTP transferase domain-containing protein [Bacteroidales bacterium]